MASYKQLLKQPNKIPLISIAINKQVWYKIVNLSRWINQTEKWAPSYVYRASKYSQDL